MYLHTHTHSLQAFFNSDVCIAQSENQVGCDCMDSVGGAFFTPDITTLTNGDFRKRALLAVSSLNLESTLSVRGRLTPPPTNWSVQLSIYTSASCLRLTGCRANVQVCSLVHLPPGFSPVEPANINVERLPRGVLWSRDDVLLVLLGFLMEHMRRNLLGPEQLQIRQSISLSALPLSLTHAMLTH